MVPRTILNDRPRPDGVKIAVLLEPGRGGAAAVHSGMALAQELGGELTVVAIAPQAPPPRCGGFSPSAYNRAVRDEVASELSVVARRLEAVGIPARRALLLEGREPSLERFLSERGVELILLPARHAWGPAKHPDARRLSRMGGLQVRVVTAGAHPSRSSSRSRARPF
jgi:hypothetical protein